MRSVAMGLWLVLAAATGAVAPASAADAPVALTDGFTITHADGATLYRALCQSCHMADGQGARGAAAYPALAGNPRLASAPYVAITVLHGRKAMPSFGAALSDAQVAEVVRYVRTQFGNRFTAPVDAADVKALR